MPRKNDDRRASEGQKVGAISLPPKSSAGLSSKTQIEIDDTGNVFNLQKERVSVPITYLNGFFFDEYETVSNNKKKLELSGVSSFF